MKALAFANNDIAVMAWTFDQRLEGCLGFAIYRVDIATGNEKPLPALARFATTPTHARQTTADAPIQKFWWKDLGAERGRTYQYRIVPLGGAPGQLVPVQGVNPLLTNPVTLTPELPPFSAYFNRGIVSTQALTHALGTPNVDRLHAEVANPKSRIRKDLQGQLFAGLTRLLDRADSENGSIQAALYELNDPLGLERRLQAADHGNPRSRTVILGNEFGEDPVTHVETDDVDSANRAELKKHVSVVDRMLPKGRIPHNKFMVLSTGGKPQAVLTGSTNWTSSGLATQTNNTLIIDSPTLAAVYAQYWAHLRADATSATAGAGHVQSSAFRDWNRARNVASIDNPVLLEDGKTRVEVHFSPSTHGLLQTPPKEKPEDMQHLFELIKGAKQAVLFLAFDPGNNSILDAAGQALRKNPRLFVRGTLTSRERAANFKDALEGAGGEPGVAIVRDPTGATREPDYRAVPAGNVGPNDVFGAWEAELLKAGFAIIHDKVVVIDPFSDDCVVVTGSHNLGYRASHNNDENMLIIHGNRQLAAAYTCHVLDLYDHYAWRYWLHKEPKTFGRPLDETDAWQDRYIKGAAEKAPELRFWLTAAVGAAPVE
jgi:phosphatidylserine/phosphatidylglycerophosphate/cardiolipin synthase-like enzyme